MLVDDRGDAWIVEVSTVNTSTLNPLYAGGFIYLGSCLGLTPLYAGGLPRMHA